MKDIVQLYMFSVVWCNVEWCHMIVYTLYTSCRMTVCFNHITVRCNCNIPVLLTSTCTNKFVKTSCLCLAQGVQVREALCQY